MCKELRLLRRMENNPASYFKLVEAYRMIENAVEKSELFVCLADALSPLAQEDIHLLARFSDPLAAVAEVWYQYQAAMSGYDDMRDFLADVGGRYDHDDDDDDYDDDFDGEDDCFA